MEYVSFPSATIKCVCFMFLVRSSEASGGTAAHGGVAQSGNAKEERDAAQVFITIWILSC